MSLSRPVARKHIHTRRIECQGYERDDGLWDIEALIVDTKTYSFENMDRGTVGSGDPVHRMHMRLTVDTDMVVQSAEASTEASPFSVCVNANLHVSELAGVTIGPGWRKAVKRVMGRTMGCTHVRDILMGALAQTAYQTIIPMRGRRKPKDPQTLTAPPAVVGTCIAYASDGPIVERQWPQFFNGKD